MKGVQPVGLLVKCVRSIGKNDSAVGKGSEGDTLEGMSVKELVVGVADEGQEERARFLRLGFGVTGACVCLLTRVGFRVNSRQTGFAEGT